MLTRREIERRQRQYWERLEAKYGLDELEEMKLDTRTVDEVMEDLGDAEFHRRRVELNKRDWAALAAN